MSTRKETRSSEAIVARSESERKIAGVAAITGLTLFVVTVASDTPESPESGRASAREIRQYAADNADVLQFALAGSLLYLALFVVFIAALVQLVRSRRPGSVAPGAILLCAAASLADNILYMAVTSPFAFPHDLDKVSDSTVVSWWNLVALAEWSQTINMAVPRMILILAFSLAALRTRLIARWICWAGFVIASAGLFQVIAVLFHIDSLDHTFLIALFGWWFWPIFVGGALGIRWVRTRPRDLAATTASNAQD
jgi:hypothetical protein